MALVQLTNASSRTCGVDGWLVITLVNAADQAVNVPTKDVAEPGESVPADLAPGDVRPGRLSKLDTGDVRPGRPSKPRELVLGRGTEHSDKWRDGWNDSVSVEWAGESSGVAEGVSS